MPARNSIKQYAENGYYHIYNRGVEKRLIFIDEQDYSVFLGYIKEYLTPKDEFNLIKMLADKKTDIKEKDKILKLLHLNNFDGEITLIAYCLMPNHFHLLIRQKSANSIDRFMQSLATRYTMYFNRKYKRVGSLFQAVYKAVLIKTEEQLLYLTAYIHRQSIALQGETLQTQASSYQDYLGTRQTKWIDTDTILAYFSKTNPRLTYRAFVEKTADLEMVYMLKIEDDN